MNQREAETGTNHADRKTIIFNTINIFDGISLVSREGKNGRRRDGMD